MVTVELGSRWQDRSGGRVFTVGVISGDKVTLDVEGQHVKDMGAKSLVHNYRQVPAPVNPVDDPVVHAALVEKAFDDGGIDAALTKAARLITKKVNAKTPEASAHRSAVKKAGEDKAGRAQGGRVKLADGSVVPGSKFITVVCGLRREDSYKADSPIRWLLKNPLVLSSQRADIVYGEALSSKEVF